MNKTPEKRTQWNRRLAVKSVFAFILHLIILLCLVTLVLVWQKDGKFTDTFTLNRANYLYIAFCIILLVWVVYFYFFFENREILVDGRKIGLVFCVVDVCFLLSYVFGKYVGMYARPVALASLLFLMLIGRKEAIFYDRCNEYSSDEAFAG